MPQGSSQFEKPEHQLKQCRARQSVGFRKTPDGESVMDSSSTENKHKCKATFFMFVVLCHTNFKLIFGLIEDIPTNFLQTVFTFVALILWVNPRDRFLRRVAYGAIPSITAEKRHLTYTSICFATEINSGIIQCYGQGGWFPAPCSLHWFCLFIAIFSKNCLPLWITANLIAPSFQQWEGTISKIKEQMHRK